jgi:tetratricopeptide (TPR) repeat protein
MKKMTLFLSCVFILFSAKTLLPQPQHQILGRVVDEAGKPLPNISFRFSHIGSVGSDDNGEFLFNLPAGIGPGSPIEIVLSETLVLRQDTLVIFEPPRGKWIVPKDPYSQPIFIKLLPKGDHRLLSKEGLKLLMNALIERETQKVAAELQAQVGKLEQQLAARSATDPLEEEASRLGFSKAELLSKLEQLKAQLQESSDPYEVGLAALYDKHFGRAAQLIQQSIEADETLIKEKSEALPDKYLNLGNAYLGDHKLTEAAAAYQKVIEQRPASYDGYYKLADVLYTKGDKEGAIKNYKKAITILQKQSSEVPTEDETYAIGYLGWIFGDIGKPDSALSYLQTSLRINRENNYQHGVANDLGSIAVIYSNLGLLDSSLFYHKSALKIHRDIQSQSGEARVLGNLGLVFRDLGQPDSARVYHRAALKIHREIGYRQGEANQLGNLGLVFSALGQPDSARVYLLMSTRIFVEIQSPRARLTFTWMNEISETMNQTLIVRGDQYLTVTKLDSAETFYRLALRDSKEFFYSPGEMRALNRLSFLLHEQTFQFPEAFEIDQLRLQLDSTNNSVLCDFAEKHFTTGRFTEAETRLAELIANQDIEENSKTALRGIGIANLLAQQKLETVKPALQKLVETVSAQPDSFNITWSFEGTKTFIRQSETLTPYREWLLTLFAAMEAENREAILVKLKEVQEQFSF